MKFSSDNFFSWNTRTLIQIHLLIIRYVWSLYASKYLTSNMVLVLTAIVCIGSSGNFVRFKFLPARDVLKQHFVQLQNAGLFWMSGLGQLFLYKALSEFHRVVSQLSNI